MELNYLYSSGSKKIYKKKYFFLLQVNGLEYLSVTNKGAREINITGSVIRIYT